MKDVPLPCERMKAELKRLQLKHKRCAGDGEMDLALKGGLLCLRIDFRDGMTWLVPFDLEAQAVLEAGSATKH